MDGRAWWSAAHGVAKSWTRLSEFPFTFHFPLSCIEEGNGNPLQCCCLENPRDGGAWWAAVYGVAQSRTRLKRLSSSSMNPYAGLPRWLSGKETTCRYTRYKRHGFDPWVEKIPWRRKWQPTPVFLPENSMDRGAWQATVPGVAKSWT